MAQPRFEGSERPSAQISNSALSADARCTESTNCDIEPRQANAARRGVACLRTRPTSRCPQTITTRLSLQRAGIAALLGDVTEGTDFLKNLERRKPAPDT